MSGVKDRFTLPGTKKNQEDLSIDPIEICGLISFTETVIERGPAAP